MKLSLKDVLEQLNFARNATIKKSGLDVNDIQIKAIVNLGNKKVVLDITEIGFNDLEKVVYLEVG